MPEIEASDESKQKARRAPVRYLHERDQLRNKSRGRFQAFLSFSPNEARHDEGLFPKPSSLSERYFFLRRLIAAEEQGPPSAPDHPGPTAASAGPARAPPAVLR